MADLDSENLTNELPEVLSGKNLLEEKDTFLHIQWRRIYRLQRNSSSYTEKL